MTADDEKKNRTSGPVQSNSFCVDGVFDMYINCAKEAYEKRELAACKTLASLPLLGWLGCVWLSSLSGVLKGARVVLPTAAARSSDVLLAEAGLIKKQP